MSNFRRNIIANSQINGEVDNYNYMTIYALENGVQAKLSDNTVSYSIDKGNTWTSLSSNTYTPTVNSGQTIMFKGNLTPTSREGIGTFTINKRCNLMGNCMSLLYGDDAASNNSLSGKDWAFSCLFEGCSTIIQVSDTFLPATTLASNCYYNMFDGCTSLTTTPELPATTLASNCYYSMFGSCSSLTTAPELPATTLANYCYSHIFYKCSSLTTAPELPATTLADYCYQYMFRASSITTAPELPATTLADYCYQHMFRECRGLTTAPELPATTLADYCYQYMFEDCTSLTTAPELPATTLTYSCYLSMFRGCSKLNYIKALFITAPASRYTSSWVSGVSSTGTFVKNKDATWSVTGTSGIPSGWTVQNA